MIHTGTRQNLLQEEDEDGTHLFGLVCVVGPAGDGDDGEDVRPAVLCAVSADVTWDAQIDGFSEQKVFVDSLVESVSFPLNKYKKVKGPVKYVGLYLTVLPVLPLEENCCIKVQPLLLFYTPGSPCLVNPSCLNVSPWAVEHEVTFLANSQPINQIKMVDSTE